MELVLCAIASTEHIGKLQIALVNDLGLFVVLAGLL